ncbi:hypothetical protein ACFQ07_31945, partial [Actinomadura adrarensis]
RAMRAVDGCGLVFLDPDNGLQVASVPPTSRLAGKYATAAEAAAFLEHGAAVVLYQHRDRQPWLRQRAKILDGLRAARPVTVPVHILRFGSRAFVCLAPEQEVSDAIKRALLELQSRAASCGNGVDVETAG